MKPALCKAQTQHGIKLPRLVVSMHTIIWYAPILKRAYRRDSFGCSPNAIPLHEKCDMSS